MIAADCYEINARTLALKSLDIFRFIFITDYDSMKANSNGFLTHI